MSTWLEANKNKKWCAKKGGRCMARRESKGMTGSIDRQTIVHSSFSACEAIDGADGDIGKRLR